MPGALSPSVGLVAALSLTVPFAALGQAFETEPVASGLYQPTSLTHAGDDSGFVFVTERHGIVRLIENDTLRPTPFLDLSSIVLSSTTERGLLGLAFHPDYESNGELFVNYTDLDGDTVLARYRVSANPRVALPGSAEVLLTIEQTAANHNGGDLHFGPDGYLYMSSGDGGATSTRYFALLINKLLGKILRIDVDGGVPYGIPPGNPFGNNPLAVDGNCGQSPCPEVWARGLRNPWRMGFDAETGDLFVGDVGQVTWEEIDLLPRGTGNQKLGWPCREGNHALPGDDLPAPPPSLCGVPFQDPILEYQHSEGRCSVTGGTVYRKPGDLYGSYLYGDYCSGEVFAAQASGQGGAWQSQPVGSAGGNLQAFGVDEGGDVYLVLRSGSILRIVNSTGIFFDGFEPGSTVRWSR